MRRTDSLLFGGVVGLGLLAGLAIGGRQDVPPDLVVDATAAPTTTAADDVVHTTVQEATTTSELAIAVSIEQRQETVIVVANAMGRGRVAGKGAALLVEAGWANVSTRDAIVVDGITRLYATPEFVEVARAVAVDLGLAGLEPGLMPERRLTDGDGSADIIVLLGRDFQR